MALDIQSILDNVASHAMSTGHLDAVLGYVSKQSPTNGITAAIYVERMLPLKTSGLANTTVRVDLEMQIYSSTYMEPYDGIDANLALATDAVFTNFIGDVELGGEARHIDIFGAYGKALEVRSGYLNLDGKELRVFQITIPVIVDDVWPQSA